jgi:hypothetical protein
VGDDMGCWRNLEMVDGFLVVEEVLVERMMGLARGWKEFLKEKIIIDVLQLSLE